MAHDDAVSLAMFWAGALMALLPLVIAAVVVIVVRRQRRSAAGRGGPHGGTVTNEPPALRERAPGARDGGGPR